MERDDIPFWERPLASLSPTQWEALCDGCGKCCLHKAEDEDTGRIYFSDIRCRLLCADTGRCGDYSNRQRQVPDCVQLSLTTLIAISWLPQSCAYRLRAAGKPLPKWHYLVCGDRDRVQAQGHGVRDWTVAEEEAGDMEDHLVRRAL